MCVCVCCINKIIETVGFNTLNKKKLREKKKKKKKRMEEEMMEEKIKKLKMKHQSKALKTKSQR